MRWTMYTLLLFCTNQKKEWSLKQFTTIGLIFKLFYILGFLSASAERIWLSPRNQIHTFHDLDSFETFKIGEDVGSNVSKKLFGTGITFPTLKFKLNLQSKYQNLHSSTAPPFTTATNFRFSPEDIMTATISDLTHAAFGQITPPSYISSLGRLKNLRKEKLITSSSPYGMKTTQGPSKPYASTYSQSPDFMITVPKVGGHIQKNKKSMESSSSQVIKYNQPLQVAESENRGSRLLSIVTAEDIGGNHPTLMPFHFPSTTSSPSSSTSTIQSIPLTFKSRPTPNRYREGMKVRSPHNRIFAPTQNPINIAHNEEELSKEDVTVFRTALSTFGSKVNHAPRTQEQFAASTPSAQPTTQYPPVTTRRGIMIHRTKILQNVPLNALTTQRNDGENLPFYKESGGVFEDKEPDSENHINLQFNDPESEVIFLPTLPPLHHMHNNKRNIHEPLPNPPRRHHHHHVTPPVEYLPAMTFRPIHSPYPIPSQPQLPSTHYQHPENLDLKSPPKYLQQPHHLNQPNHSYRPHLHSHPEVPYNYQQTRQAFHVPHSDAPIIRNVPPRVEYHHFRSPEEQLRRLPQPPPRNTQHKYDAHHNHLPVTTTTEKNIHFFDPPPPRNDPASDYFYGDPRPPPPTPPSTLKSVIQEEVKDSPSDEDDEEDSQKKGHSQQKESKEDEDDDTEEESGEEDEDEGKENLDDGDDEEKEDPNHDEPPPRTPPHENKDSDRHYEHNHRPHKSNDARRPGQDGRDFQPEQGRDFRKSNARVNVDNQQENKNGYGRNLPFRPSMSFTPFRPSLLIQGGFEFGYQNPNEKKPQPQSDYRNRFPESYDQRSQGRIGANGNPSSGIKTSLDPIYTMTIKEYDEHLKNRQKSKRNYDRENPIIQKSAPTPITFDNENFKFPAEFNFEPSSEEGKSGLTGADEDFDPEDDFGRSNQEKLEEEDDNVSNYRHDVDKDPRSPSARKRNKKESDEKDGKLENEDDVQSDANRRHDQIKRPPREEPKSNKTATLSTS